MGIFDISAILLTLAALFSFINYRFVKLPMTIGVMVIALATSLVVVLAGELVAPQLKAPAEYLLSQIDFDETLLHGMLSLLLFAGALHINLSDLGEQKSVIGLLATVGIAVSTLLIGSMTWLVLGWLSIPVPFIYCLLFGSLISPTDPIAVLGILKTAGASKSLETKTVGESLFNDGIGVVVFLVLLKIADGGDLGAGDVAWLFVKEAVGGAVFGLVIGLIAYQLLKRTDNYQVEIMTTLALAMGGYSLAEALHVSAPIAIVVAGLLIGNQGRAMAMSDVTRDRLDSFWELIDEILNAVLFVLIGLEVLVMPITAGYLVAAVAIIPVTLLARFISVWSVLAALRRRRDFSPGAEVILTWGGLRGAISVAMALSLPAGEYRSVILAITYGVVIFSIIVQGLTISRLIKRYGKEATAELDATG